MLKIKPNKTDWSFKIYGNYQINKKEIREITKWRRNHSEKSYKPCDGNMPYRLKDRKLGVYKFCLELTDQDYVKFALKFLTSSNTI